MNRTLLVLILTLGLLTRCSPCPESSTDYENHLERFESLKQKLLRHSVKLSRVETPLTVEALRLIVPEANKELAYLANTLGLCEVDYYEKVGIEFTFNCTDENCNNYLLTFIDIDKRKEFISYEQFLDYQTELVDINRDRTFIKTEYYPD